MHSLASSPLSKEHIGGGFLAVVASRIPKVHFSTTKSIFLLFPISGFLLHKSALSHSFAVLISSGWEMKVSESGEH